MKLDQLQSRLKEIETALINAANSYNVIQGHKQELEYQISELQKELSQDNNAASEIKVDQPVVNLDGTPVE